MLVQDAGACCVAAACVAGAHALEGIRCYLCVLMVRTRTINCHSTPKVATMKHDHMLMHAATRSCNKYNETCRPMRHGNQEPPPTRH